MVSSFVFASEKVKNAMNWEPATIEKLEEASLKNYQTFKNVNDLKKDLKAHVRQAEWPDIDASFANDTGALPTMTIRNGEFNITVDGTVHRMKLNPIETKTVVINGQTIDMRPEISYKDQIKQISEALKQKRAFWQRLILPEANGCTWCVVLPAVFLSGWTGADDAHFEDQLGGAQNQMGMALEDCQNLGTGKPPTCCVDGQAATGPKQVDAVNSKMDKLSNDFCGGWWH